MVIKNQKTRKNKSQFLLIGSLLLLIGISLISGKLLININNKSIEEDSLNNFYEEQIIHEVILDEETKEVIKEPSKKVEENNNIIDYIAVLNIPKIGLEKGLVSKNSYLNNVNRNIEILDESDMPDQEKGNFILASHSGYGKTAYFKNIHKLKQDDLITVHYNQLKYEYKVVNMYEIEKNGSAHIVRNANKDTLTLITCITNTEKQLVVIAEKVGE